MHRALTIALLLAGCTTIPVRPVAPEDVELVEIAASDLGFGVDWTNEGIEVVFFAERQPYPGEQFGRGCRRRVESTRDTSVLRHEIGHALLGPDHHPDPANVMHEYVGRDTTRLTVKQRRQARREVAILHACAEAGRRKR